MRTLCFCRSRPASTSRARSPPAEHLDLFLDQLASEQQATSDIFHLLDRSAGGGLVVQVVVDRLLFGQRGVNVLGVDTDLAAKAPFQLAIERFDRVADRSQEGRFALAVVADDADAGAVVDFELDLRGDFVVGVTDRQLLGPQGTALARVDDRKVELDRRLFALDFDEMQPFELLRFVACLAGGVGVGAVFVDECFELLAFGQRGGVDALVVVTTFGQIIEVLVDIARKHCHFATRNFERVVAGPLEKRPIVRDDEAAAAEVAQEFFEQHLCAKVKKVSRFVEDQQVGVVQQQGRQFHTGLPTAGKRTDRLVEHRVGQLKLPSDFAASPLGLAAVASQKAKNCFALFKRIVLPQVAEPQLATPHNLSGVEFFVAEQDPAKRTFASTIAANKADLLIVG